MIAWRSGRFKRETLIFLLEFNIYSGLALSKQRSNFAQTVSEWKITIINGLSFNYLNETTKSSKCKGKVE